MTNTNLCALALVLATIAAACFADRAHSRDDIVAAATAVAGEPASRRSPRTTTRVERGSAVHATGALKRNTRTFIGARVRCWVVVDVEACVDRVGRPRSSR
jgi:hypothetical protein